MVTRDANRDVPAPTARGADPSPVPAGPAGHENLATAVRVKAPAKRIEASLVRFTPEEFRRVAERARECGVPLARFLRETALGAVPRARRTPANAELIRQLARIGTELRRLVCEAPGAVGGPDTGAGQTPLDRPPGAGTGAVDAVLAQLLDVIRRVGVVRLG